MPPLVDTDSLLHAYLPKHSPAETHCRCSTTPHKSWTARRPTDISPVFYRRGMSPVPHDHPIGNNERVQLDDIAVLSDNWYTLRKVEYRYESSDGTWSTQRREAYDRGNGATVLLIDWTRETILLTRQFRICTYLNGHADGMFIETAAGLLDDDDAETAIRREAQEETGTVIDSITPLFDLYMSPGSVTERVAFFVAEYTSANRVTEGGGLDEEGEDIEVLEVTLDDALNQISAGVICDAKTVLLLQWAQLQRALAKNDETRR